ncbi:TPA: IS4 family transposase [Legionella pneumophila]|nr:IS4 family transposase [Legionella pneumophila]RYW29548.1 IS4 family transposase [Legionella pneumophila]HAT1866955.1 IS4 family transposase [Legionella pneumophila]HAT1907082.1 IS4 family transposase [Legionella pneumophila]HAT1983776.1 IS4 family transposase [Legionella pneumophila]
MLHELAGYCLNHFETQKLPHINYLNEFSGVNIVDSSNISLHHSLNILFKGSGGAASNAAVKIQLMFDYLQGQIKALTLTSGCDNDQGFDNYFETIQTGALYLMDLGYFKLNSFKKIIEGNAYFVSCLLTGTNLLELDGKPIELIKILSSSGSLSSHQLLMGAKHKIPIRLVAQRLSQSIAAKRRHRLIEDHRRRGSKPSHESLALQDWSIYITNTSETQIGNEEICKCYSWRWQIELVFKLSKSLMHIDCICTTKSARVVIETYGKFIGMMFLFLLCAPVRYQNNREVSFYKACKLLITKLNDFVRAWNSPYRLKHFL